MRPRTSVQSAWFSACVIKRGVWWKSTASAVIYKISHHCESDKVKYHEKKEFYHNFFLWNSESFFHLPATRQGACFTNCSNTGSYLARFAAKASQAICLIGRIHNVMLTKQISVLILLSHELGKSNVTSRRTSSFQVNQSKQCRSTIHES